MSDDLYRRVIRLIGARNVGCEKENTGKADGSEYTSGNNDERRANFHRF
jgi:hypothetical protein